MDIEAIRSKVPDAKPVMAGGQEIGITTRDGSLDYTPAGAKYLGSLRFDSQKVKPQVEQRATVPSGIKDY